MVNGVQCKDQRKSESSRTENADEVFALVLVYSGQAMHDRAAVTFEKLPTVMEEKSPSFRGKSKSEESHNSTMRMYCNLLGSTPPRSGLRHYYVSKM